MADASLTERNRARHADEAASWVRDRCEHLPPVEKAELFGTVFDRFADSRVVLLGEATHGSSEFYRARAAITRRLIEHHGFNIVAIEADWPDAARVDRYVRHKRTGRYDEETFARFPTWMWRNREFADFVEWLRRHNEGLAEGDRAELRGLDVYSLNASIAAVIHYLDRVDPEAAGEARRRYGCLTPWQAEPAFYGRAMLRGGRDTCEDEVVAQLQELLDKRLEYAAADGEDFFDAAQNARVARAAEHYYRIMYHGSTESWNLRDRHMFDTLQHLLAARGDKAKAVVWAHNSHIGNAAATAMGWQGEFNIGELCRTAYGEGAVLIGFGTDRGTVAAADDWDGPMRIKRINPSRPDSYERVFRQSGVAHSLTDLRAPGNRELREVLSTPRLERAIGVIYREQSEFLSHYFEAVLPEQFDAFVWFDETNAVTPLPAERPHGVAETYPFGV
ncbi:erythromycin esterase family protein [Chelativorans salis]|uniref:Erythromycin esterase family protein n=1 Tax=Chelativorans salis TaxID=2978478 RepID=A0ABT2LT32_9HYPH|nr:erythromycin esterase family protein [Chelativorans sp. EGI FJ00035]MCT7377007.1 erythromycin esterase family protein [Chelativorans sp. EGI FJ00035]